VRLCIGRGRVHGITSRSRSPGALSWAMQMEFAAVLRPGPEGCVAFVEELPGANTQGAALAEARQNLQDPMR
jgi:hypothetical protein